MVLKLTTLKSSLTGAVAMVMDTQAANRWLYRTIAVEPIQLQNNNMDFLIRVVSDFPWPFKDRKQLLKEKFPKIAIHTALPSKVTA